jgi:hypothetical protein
MKSNRCNYCTSDRRNAGDGDGNKQVSQGAEIGRLDPQQFQQSPCGGDLDNVGREQVGAKNRSVAGS